MGPFSEFFPHSDDSISVTFLQEKISWLSSFSFFGMLPTFSLCLYSELNCTTVSVILRYLQLCWCTSHSFQICSCLLLTFPGEGFTLTLTFIHSFGTLCLLWLLVVFAWRYVLCIFFWLCVVQSASNKVYAVQASPCPFSSHGLAQLCEKALLMWLCTMHLSSHLLLYDTSQGTVEGWWLCFLTSQAVVKTSG